MKKGYKKCPFCANEIKEGAIKCQYCKEFLEDKKEEKCQKEKVSQKEKRIDEKLCRFCKKNYATEEDSRVIHATRELNRVSVVVARYVKYETKDIVVPRCKACHEKQKLNIKISALKCFGIPFLFGFILGACFGHGVKNGLLCGLWFMFFGGVRFFFTYNEISGSLSYSDYPEWKELKKEGRYSSFS